MKILGLIPARSGSKGIPGKNTKILGDKPLIFYTLEKAMASDYLDTVFISSEDKLTLDLCSSKFKINIPFTRPIELSDDNTPMFEVIKHVIESFKLRGLFYDAVCLLQPTVPFRKKDEIDDAINKFYSSNADTLLSIRKIPKQFNPNWLLKVTDADKVQFLVENESIATSRQSLQDYYYRDGSIYIFKTSNIGRGSIYGTHIISIVNDNENYVNLDEMEDWIKAENILKSD